MSKFPLFAVLVVVFSTLQSAANETIATAKIDWHLWESTPVHCDGRVKPLDTFARESLHIMTQQSTVVDSVSNQSLSPTALYLTLLFEWSGWDDPRKEQLLSVSDVATEYTFYHLADRWDKTPLLSVEHPGLKQILGLPEHVAFVSPATLSTVSLIDPRTQKSVPFATWGRKLQERKDADEALSHMEMTGLELSQRLRAYQAERMGLNIGIVPKLKTNEGRWLSLAALMVTKFDDVADMSGSYRQLQQKAWQARSAFLKGDADAFNQASREFREVTDSICAAAPTSPSRYRLAIEVAYNHWQPFHLAEFFMMVAVLANWVAASTKSTRAYWTAYALYVVAACALIMGIAMRTVSSGRPPIATMYETIVTVATGAILFGLIWEAWGRSRYLLAATASISLAALLAANHCSNFVEYQIQPLEPVLRSPVWLVAHVLAATMSYAAFAVAMGAANITLGYYGMRVRRPELTHSLLHVAARSIQVGIVSLSIGMLLGSIWADSAWGRFWAWDPKEVWTLITVLCYIAVLRAQQNGQLTERGFAVASALCFSLVIMTWHGLNLMLRTGLHSYGFSSGGGPLVCIALFLQIAYVIGAVVRSENEQQLEIVGQIVNNAG
jgi:ABC-type transport system involved in cytochrome c biogenesis permease subunit